jgi:acetyl-CoA carboxylase alpha subunit
LRASLAELSKMTPKQLIDDRYDKFRKMGSFFTETAVVGR